MESEPELLERLRAANAERINLREKLTYLQIKKNPNCYRELSMKKHFLLFMEKADSHNLK